MDYNNISFIFHSWMVTKLNLSSNELIVYMAINNFSQGQAGKYYGGLRFLEKITGASRSTVIRSLNNLVQKGYVIKEEEVRNNITYTSYSANPEYTNWGGVKLTPVSNCSEGSVNLEQGGINLEQYNKENNKINNKDEKENINSSNDSFISKEKPTKSNKEPQGIRPSKEEVEAFIKERGYHISYQDMDDYYTNYGKYPFWMMMSQKKEGKEPPFVKSWKGCCKTFEDNWKRRNGNQPAYRKIDSDDPWVQSMRELSEKAMKEQEKKYAKGRPTKAEHDLLVKQLYS